VNLLTTTFAKINRASLRERALLFVAASGLLALAWNYALLTPLEARRTAFVRSLEEVSERLAAAGPGQGQDGLVEQYALLKAREAALASGIAVVDGQLKDAQAGMIEPTQMATVLADVLSRQKDLTLVLLRNLPVEPLLPPIAPPASGAVTSPATGAATAPAPRTDMGPYIHPVELIVRGNYLSVLSYLQELESRPWGFQWRRLEFTTTADGPQYRIEFTTLSMQSNWLGV
jgi:MSHA biogenesis protein MshJ